MLSNEVFAVEPNLKKATDIYIFFSDKATGGAL